MVFSDYFPLWLQNPEVRDRVRSDIRATAPLNVGGRSYKTFHGSFQRTIDKYGWKNRTLWPLLRNGTVKNTGDGVFYDTGGPFWSQSFTIGEPTLNVNQPFWLAGANYSYKGPLFPSVSRFSLASGLTAKNIRSGLTESGVTWLDLMAHGATGIARSIPTIPETSIFTILGEIREGLFSAPGYQTAKLFKAAPDWAARWQLGLKSASTEFLNWIFGIAPFVSDVNGLVLVNTHDYQALRDRLNSDLSHVYRRRRVLKDETTRSQEILNGTYPDPAPVAYICKPGVLTIDRVKRQKVWFSGAFSHSSWSPTVNAKLNELLRTMENYGALPNAERIWQLVPWSWLVDWFTNMGSILTNISYLGHGGLRLLYGYVMAETTTTVTYTWTGLFGYPPKPVSTSMTTTEVVKQRWAASPYGFGLEFGDLSWSQKAILAALGITRTRLIRSSQIFG